MKKAVILILVGFGLVVLYQRQHIRPIDDPKDSPIFEERLKNSLERFQTDALPQQRAAQMQAQQAQAGSGSPAALAARPSATANGLTGDGRCGTVNLTWVEQGRIAKGSLAVKRRAAGESAFTHLASARIYDRAEAGGTRYWTADEGLQNNVSYEYLVSGQDVQGRALTRGPLKIDLMCTAQDREYLARRDQAIQEYYKSKGIKADASGAGRQALPQAAPQATPVQPGLVVGGRCGKTTVTWLEAAKISRESIRVKRTQPDGTSTQLASVTVYDRAEAQGTRYWLADSGLPDNQRYEYSLRYKDMAGREIVQGPAAINLTCTEQDKAFLAQQRKALEEHYRQQGIEAPQQAAPAAPAGYELSSQVYQVDPGTSPRKGSRNAAVRIVVFTDFECVHCGTWARTLDALLQQHPRDVQIVFKSFPIPYHQHAEQAALAAFAAGRQGMFWEMHDLLFQNPQALTEADARTYATAIGLKVDEFEQSLRDDTFKKIIAEDRALGLKLGVKNAPTTFINGRSLVGSPPLDYVQDIVRKILAGRVGR